MNFTVPSFIYGGEVYDRIGVVSNGYVVVGGGAAGDVEYEPPASFPDPATPNNVIAPFWTDLNPADGGGIRVGRSGVSISDVDTDAAYVLRTSPPTAGGVVSFDYTVKGLLRGTWSTSATLRSGAINTYPIEVTQITVK
ncbi:MAG: hypothetical protein EAS51_10135 [Microbacteriaceae bacterium]|nr:MAG: hypothetical protein EAS51_10135 [Microbacteriaceae bacterium]